MVKNTSKKSSKDIGTVVKAVAFTRQRDNLAAVSEAVKHGGSKDGIAKDGGPGVEALVGSDDKGGGVAELGDDLEKEVGFGARNG